MIEKDHSTTTIGFASARTEPGDLVYQFPGVATAIILRRVSAATATYKIVGRARLGCILHRNNSDESFMFTEPCRRIPLYPQERAQFLEMETRTRGWGTLDLLKLAYEVR